MLLNDYIIVEKYDDVQKHGVGGFIKPVVNNNLGVVLECSEKSSELEKGCLVYFLNKYERAYFEGRDVYVMKIDNIFKVLQNGAQENRGI